MSNSGKCYLGTLCKRGHEYEDTGKSLRYPKGDCVECIKLNSKKQIESGANKGRSKEYYYKNRDYALRRRKEYYEENKDEILQKLRAYKDKHKEWYREYGRQHYKKNKDKYRKNNKAGKLRRDYGLTLEDYNQMAEAQGHRCLICNVYGKTLVVDHCHTTGKVRGLLCHNCNLGIGYMQHDIQTLLNAAEYLEDS